MIRHIRSCGGGRGNCGLPRCAGFLYRSERRKPIPIPSGLCYLRLLLLYGVHAFENCGLGRKAAGPGRDFRLVRRPNFCFSSQTWSNPVKPSQTKAVGLTAHLGGRGGKAALARAHSKAACRPRGLHAKRLGARNGSSDSDSERRFSIGFQRHRDRKADCKSALQTASISCGA